MSFEYASWPTPANVRAGWSTRQSGFSQGDFSCNNVAWHVAGDSAVALNRQLLQSRMIGQPTIQWLHQTHSTVVTKAEAANLAAEQDAAYTREAGLACCVMTADCLPVFFWTASGDQVAVAHAGWRGLANGILSNTLQTFSVSSQVTCGIGPAISKSHFEVGNDVREAFACWPGADQAFESALQPNKYWCDLSSLAASQLLALGVRNVYFSSRCTFAESHHFYSYRRDGRTGRMANLIWQTSI